MIEVFKIIKGFENIDRDQFFMFSNTVTRGHEYKLFKNSVRTDTGKFLFSHRVIDEWNSLPDYVVACNSVNDFKIKLDNHFKNGRGFI